MRYISRLGIAALAALVSVSALYAQATKEFYSDEFVSGKLLPEASNVYADPSVTLDFNNQSDPQAPEGTAVIAAGTGGSAGGFGIYTSVPQDYTAYAGGAIRFWLKSNTNLTLQVQDSLGHVRTFSVVPTATNVWEEEVVPFSSFSTVAGFDFSKILYVFFTRSSSANKNWSIDHIRWTKPVANLAIFPSNAQVNPNKHREFTVEGRDAAGDLVVIYSSFTTNAGVVNPPAPTLVTASTLTASGSPGSGSVTAALVGVTTAAAVSITSNNLDSAFGLLSETIPGVALDTDSYLGVSNGAGDTISVGDSTDHVEGTTSLLTTVATGASGFAGWYIQWGLSTDASSTRDMSNFYDGSVRFWFKSTGNLSGKLKCGIRSVNVTAGTELSYVYLNSSYAADGAANIFDGQWHPITLPIAPFARARPWADLSRTKVLFSAYAVGDGAAGASGAFYVDNLRWDTRLPGPLASIQVTPSPITLPWSAKRIFNAVGLDAAGVSVDILPTWSTTVPGATVNSAAQLSTLFSAPFSNASGNVTATAGAVSGSASVTVAQLVVNQSYNVYSDQGAGGTVGVSYGGAPGTGLYLQELNTGSIEGTKFFRSTYTLDVNVSFPLAFANWYVEETNTSRFMNDYANGYLQFYVRTSADLVFSVRSSNITPGTETSKFTLSELGIPLDNNWQLVVVSLADLKARDARLDLTVIQTYFAITAQSDVSGANAAPRQFDVDDVKWVTSTPPPDGSKIYAGLQGKQNASTGLVLSYDLDPNLRAVTYDNALAVMAYTYQKDFTRAAKVLSAYQTRFNLGGFAGFHDNYKWDVPGAATVVAPDQRTAGPNAWLLLAIIHYRNASLDRSFDAMATGIAAWLETLQAGDGALTFGYIGGTAQANKSTEHNFDAYAAFYAYSKAFNDSTSTTAASKVRNWLTTAAWTGSRFVVGFNSTGGANTDRALDVYSWAPLALSSYTSVLTNPVNGAEVSFSTKNVNVNTGLLVDGFDFSSFPSALGNNDAPADKDAVWLEGTAQMALAYLESGNSSKWDYYLGQLGFAIFTTGGNTQGLTYATNPGTAYSTGFIMDATHASASSMAWYLFAKNQFNPFKPFAIQSTQIMRVADNLAAPSVTWSSVAAPVPHAQRWILADDYVQLDAQPITSDAWGIQIYTDNTNPNQSLRYVDPTPGNTINPDSDPAGLLQSIPGVNSTSHKLSLAWRIQDSTFPVPAAVAPYSPLAPTEGPQAINWFYFMDRATPAIDEDGNGSVGGPNDGVAFQDGQVSYCIIRTPSGIQTQQGSYVPSANPNYIYFESDFSPAPAQVQYTTQIIFEFFKV